MSDVQVGEEVLPREEAQPRTPEGPKITVAMIDDEPLVLRSLGRCLRHSIDEVALFREADGNSQVDALVDKIREALAQGRRVVVLSDGSMPNGTSPLTITDALFAAGLLLTRAALEAWINDADRDRPIGAPVLMMSGGIPNATLRQKINTAILEGSILGFIEKPPIIDHLREVILALAMAERAELRAILEQSKDSSSHL